MTLRESRLSECASLLASLPAGRFVGTRVPKASVHGLGRARGGGILGAYFSQDHLRVRASMAGVDARLTLLLRFESRDALALSSSC